MNQQTKPLLPLYAFLQETVAFIFSACTRAEKLTPHLHFSARWNDLHASVSRAVLGGW
jgi:hypothetical protein